MRINTNTRKIYLFELLMLVAILVFCVYMADFSVLFKTYTIIAAFAVILIASIVALGYRKDRHYLRGNATRAIITVTLAVAIISFTAGIFLGFNRSYASFNIAKNFEGFVPAILLAVVTELLRQTLYRKGESKGLNVVFFTTLTSLTYILLALNPSRLVDVESVFLFLCGAVFPVIATELLCSYFTKNIGLQPSLVYKLIVKCYVYVLPIIPNLGNYIVAVISILMPFVIYRMVEQMDTFDSRARQRMHKINMSIITIPLAVFLVILVAFVSGFFNYWLIAVGSDSMAGTFERGDAVMIEKMPADKLKENDIIAFRKDGIIVTHRVVEIKKDGDRYEFITKGDANEDVDGFTTPGENIIGRINFRTKYIGFPTLWMNAIFNREI